MSWVNKNWRLMAACAMLAAAGCASRPGPFGDVVRKSQEEPTTVATAAEAEKAPVPAKTEAGEEAKEKPLPVATPEASQSESAPAQPIVVAATKKTADVYVPMPAEVDRTGARRDWPRSQAMRPVGNTVSWPVYFGSISDKAPDDLTELFLEPGIFVLDTVLVPVKMFIVPPWREEVTDEVKDEGRQPADH